MLSRREKTVSRNRRQEGFCSLVERAPWPCLAIPAQGPGVSFGNNPGSLRVKVIWVTTMSYLAIEVGPNNTIPGTLLVLCLWWSFTVRISPVCYVACHRIQLMASSPQDTCKAWAMCCICSGVGWASWLQLGYQEHSPVKSYGSVITWEAGPQWWGQNGKREELLSCPKGTQASNPMCLGHYHPLRVRFAHFQLYRAAKWNTRKLS